VHFYSTFWSLKRSNRGTAKFFQPVDAVPRRRVLAHRAVLPARAPTCSLPRPRAPRPRAPRLPRPEPSGVVPWRTALRCRTRVPPASKGGGKEPAALKCLPLLVAHSRIPISPSSPAELLVARSEPPPAPLLAATASSGLRSTARQIKRSLTFLCTPPSSPAYPSYPQSPTAPVQQAAAATVAGRRCRPSPTSSPPRASTGIGPQGPRDPPPPVPGRPQPAVGWNLAGPPLAGRQGPHCKEVVVLEGLTAKLQLK
jgi:hypothetical protein